MSSFFEEGVKQMGPGFITGAADDDPSGIGTYSQAGAFLGYQALWTTVFTLPFMIAIQEMCARIGMVTGRGLGGNLRRRYSPSLVAGLIGLLFIANTINIGADLGMMVAAARLLVPLQATTLLFLMTGVTLLLQIFTTYATYAKYLKLLTLSLFAYVGVAFVVHVDWMQVWQGTFFPAMKWTPDALMMIVAILGTTISPYLYFWQANQEVEEQELFGGNKHAEHPPQHRLFPRAIQHMRADVIFGMGFSNVVAWFIMLTGAAVLFRNGIFFVTSADQAAQLLAPLAGKFASLLFAAGIVGTGLLALPVLSGSVAYAVSELFHAPEGLSKTWKQARGFYGIIMLTTLIGLAMNFFGINPVRALVYAALCNAIAAPPLLIAVMFIGNDREFMGKHANGRWSQALGWATVVLMSVAVIAWAWVSRS